jgi:alpha-methylacyl-CoA racemase
VGPLTGVRVIELAGIGPVPYAAMLLGDLGADVIRVDRPGSARLGVERLTCRNRRSIGLDLKQRAAVETVLDLVATGDIALEGLRPGVAERLGIGPDACLDRNPRLVYGRMTGWGQQGPHHDRAGHDINYIGLSGALGSIGGADGKPIVPLNLIGDAGGGALFLVMGVLAGLIERGSSGRGQVIDTAVVDGSASLMTMLYELQALGLWTGRRGENLLDGGAPFYDTYETADGEWMSVGALESQFFSALLDGLEVTGFAVADQYDRALWPELRKEMEGAFRRRTRDEWTEVFGDSDACVWPVLDMVDAPRHPLNEVRRVFTEVGGVMQAGPAPRFSRSACAQVRPAPDPGADTDSLLIELGYEPARIELLHQTGAVFSSEG